ncbi:MAG: GNAT family N-acetyltransferase [Arenibacterium sp.]
MDSLTRVSIQHCTELSPAAERVISAHLAHSNANNDPESNHAEAASELFVPGVRFWTAQLAGGDAVGCTALRDLGRSQGELKSMHVLPEARGQGVAAALLEHVVTTARAENYREILLETGSAEAYLAARNLYLSFGFTYCAPFADYTVDANSVFMRLALATG